jgi:hypothetical protein
MLKFSFPAACVLSLLAAGIVVGAAGCHTEAPTPDTHGAPRGHNPRAEVGAGLEVDGYPVIVRVVGRHQTITVTAGPECPLYTAETTDGKLLVASATLEQLRSEHPEVYRQLNPSVAEESDADNGGAQNASDASNPESTGPSSAGLDASMLLMSADW